MVNAPPRYVNTPAWLAYGDELSPAVFRTFVRIYGLGWNHDYEWTDPVGLDDLYRLCGLSRRQLFAHLRSLVNRHVLRYVYSRATDLYVFDLRSAHSPPGGAESQQPDLLSAENRTEVGLLDVVAGDPDMEHISVPIKGYVAHMRQQQQQRGGMGGDAQCEKPHSGQSGEPDRPLRQAQDRPPDFEARLDVLTRMGVLEPTLSELAGLEWADAAYLQGWAAWLEAQQSKVQPGLVVEQIRRGHRAPAVAVRRTRSSAPGRERYREWQR